MSDDDPQREPTTTSDEYRAEVLDTEVCDGADGFECGRELTRGEDEINVTEYGPGAERNGRRVLCADCRAKQDAVQLAEMPDLAALHTDEEIEELIERFPDIFDDFEPEGSD